MQDERAGEFVDANILVYAHDDSAGIKHDMSIQLVRDLWASEQGCLSLQVLQEFYVTATRKIKRPISPLAGREIVKAISAWRCHIPEVDDLLQATDIQQRYGLSLWDAMIIRSAQRLGFRKLWSEDLNAGQVYEGVTVFNPFSQQ